MVVKIRPKQTTGLARHGIVNMKDFFEFRELSLGSLKEEYSSSDAYDMSPEEIAKVLTKFIKDADKRSKAKATKLIKLRA